MQDLVKDFGYKGKNFLVGFGNDMFVIFNEDGMLFFGILVVDYIDVLISFGFSIVIEVVDGIGLVEVVVDIFVDLIILVIFVVFDDGDIIIIIGGDGFMIGIFSVLFISMVVDFNIVLNVMDGVFLIYD